MTQPAISQQLPIKEHSAFYQELYATLFQRLIDVGARVSSDRALVEDCVHGLFEYFLNDPTKLEGVENIEAYLSISLKRKLVKAVKKERNIVSADNLMSHFSIPSPEVELISRENDFLQIKRLRKAMSQLSPGEARAVKSRFYDGFSYEQIAAANNSTKRTVYNQVHSAIKKLKGLL